MFNLDMVGCFNEEKILFVNGVGILFEWDGLFVDLFVGGIFMVVLEFGIGLSDYIFFYLEDIFVFYFFIGQYEDYYKLEDDFELVNYKGLLFIIDYILVLIEELDDVGKIVFIKIKDEQESCCLVEYKVMFGVMLDYVFQGIGMCIDGVMQGCMADNVGMKKGDIILKIGDIVVKDIYGYMEGLG